MSTATLEPEVTTPAASDSDRDDRRRASSEPPTAIPIAQAEGGGDRWYRRSYQMGAGTLITLLILLMVIIGGMAGWIWSLSGDNNATSASLAAEQKARQEVEAAYAAYVQQTGDYIRQIEKDFNERSKALAGLLGELDELRKEDAKDLESLRQLVADLEASKNALVSLRQQFAERLAEAKANKERTDQLELQITALSSTINSMQGRINILGSQVNTALARARAAEAATGSIFGKLFGRR